MDVIADAALTHLQTVISGYLPAPSSNAIDRELLLVPKKIKPTGIGAYIGLHDTPNDEIYGRLLELDAEVHVSANSSNLSLINAEISGITRSLMTTDRQTLRSDGIYKLALSSLSPPDADNRNARTARFSLFCEYQQIPQQSGDSISRIDLVQLLNPANGRAQFICNLSGESLVHQADPLADFLPLTDSDINQGSASANWIFNAAQTRIEQTNDVRGGGLTSASARKAGAQLLIRPGGIAAPLQHLLLQYDFDSTDPDGMGCVFRYQDSENFYYFLASQRHDYQIFGKKVNGNWSFLDEGGLGTTSGIDFSSRQRAQLVVLENHFQAYANGKLVAQGRDSSLPQAGECGLLCHGNNAAFFYNLDLVKLTH